MVLMKKKGTSCKRWKGNIWTIMKSDYLRLVLYELLSVLAIVCFSILEHLFLYLKPNTLNLINCILTYLIVTVFGILFLNNLSQANKIEPTSPHTYYAGYYFLYFLFVIPLVGVTELFVLAPMGLSFLDIRYIGFSRVFLFVYLIILFYLYVKYRNSIKGLVWF